VNNVFKHLKPGGSFIGLDENPAYKLAFNLQEVHVGIDKPEVLEFKYIGTDKYIARHLFDNEVWEEVFEKAGFEQFRFVNFKPADED
jgi:hypothetical protein